MDLNDRETVKPCSRLRVHGCMACFMPSKTYCPHEPTANHKATSILHDGHLPALSLVVRLMAGKVVLFQLTNVPHMPPLHNMRTKPTRGSTRIAIRWYSGAARLGRANTTRCLCILRRYPEAGRDTEYCRRGLLHLQ